MEKKAHEEKQYQSITSGCSGSALGSDQECLECGFKCIEGTV